MILWLHSDRQGCGTYRCLIPARGIQDTTGVDSTFIQQDELTDDPSFVDQALDGITTVVFQRAIGTPFLSWMRRCRERGVRVVIEMDDDLFHVAKHNPAYWYWSKKSTQHALRAQLDAADHVIVSTRPLRHEVMAAMRWGSPDKIAICHNHLHLAIWGREVWETTDLHPNTGLVIGWQGSNTHDQDFKVVIPALQRLFAERTDVTLRVFGGVPKTLKGAIPMNRFQWVNGVQFDRYPFVLRRLNFDIAIAPLADTAFNRSKSSLRYLEASALGVPVVASPVYPYKTTIEDGRTGLLAATPDAWHAHLTLLLNDAILRRKMGADAQDAVWRQWDTQAHISSWYPAIGVSDVHAADPQLRRHA